MFKNAPNLGLVAPYAVSLVLPVTVIIAAIYGGWAIALVPFYGIFLERRVSLGFTAVLFAGVVVEHGAFRSGFASFCFYNGAFQYGFTAFCV